MLEINSQTFSQFLTPAEQRNMTDAKWQKKFNIIH